MLKSKPQPAARPYWHVDMKWVCGILFALGLWLALALYALTVLTSERIAVPLATQIAAQLVSRSGLDDPTDINALKQKASQQPGNDVETLPGVFVTKADLQTLTPRALRLKIFGEVVKPYYELGAKGVAAKQTADPQKRAEIEQQVGLLGLVNQSNHDILVRVFWLSLALLVIPLAGLVYFSAGFGRLVSPGIIMALSTLASAPLAVLLQIAAHSTKPAGDQPGPLPGVTADSFATVVRALLPGFLAVFALGMLLLLVAAIGKVVSRHRTRPA